MPHENKVLLDVENLRKTYKKSESASSETHTKIIVLNKTKNTENGSPNEQKHLAF